MPSATRAHLYLLLIHKPPKKERLMQCVPTPATRTSRTTRPWISVVLASTPMQLLWINRARVRRQMESSATSTAFPHTAGLTAVGKQATVTHMFRLTSTRGKCVAGTTATRPQVMVIHFFIQKLITKMDTAD